MSSAGWSLQSAELASQLIQETCRKQSIGQLTVHADRGSSMKSKLVAQLLADPGVTKTHSRPYVSDDNPFSEAQFRTLKYRPEFPQRFGSIQDTRAFCGPFFQWYNNLHHHSGIGLHRTASTIIWPAKFIWPEIALCSRPGPPTRKDLLTRNQHRHHCRMRSG